MDWFRHYHGLCTDPKLHRIARAAKVSRGLVIAAWCAILETASQNDPRGCADDVDETSLAFMIDVKPSVAGRILEAIQAAGLIAADGHVAAWSKRQRASDDVAARVAKHREQKAVNEVLGKKRVHHDRAHINNPLAENETGHDGNDTKSARTEQNRTDKESPSSDDAVVAFPSRNAELARAFDTEFWSAYPRKKGKAAAKAKFIAKAKGCGVSAIMDGLERAKAEWARKGTEVEFIPHPATWLNQGRWEDEPDGRGSSKPQRRSTVNTEPGKLYADCF